MKRLIILALLMVATSVGAQDKGKPQRAQDWISLFNGKDLSGWTMKTEGEGVENIWRVKDGVIDCDPRLKPRGDKNLWTEESFGDFTLYVEWRIKEKKGSYDVPVVLPDGTYKTDENGERILHPQPGADSGILMRGQGKSQVNIWCWPIGSGEVYGYRNDAKQPAEVRAAATPKVNADKPVGEWNIFGITLIGDRLTVVLNGKTVIENAQLPGVPEEGPIALQHHGGYDEENDTWNGASSLVQFRTIRIRPL